MHSRIELHQALCAIPGVAKVYFQPPENVKLVYPCIVYSRKDIQNRSANNNVYSQNWFYEVVVIDKNPDSSIVVSLSKFSGCYYNMHYVSDNLNHDVFTLYY